MTMSYFSFKVQKGQIFKVLNLKKKNFIGLVLWYFSLHLDLNLRENEKIYTVLLIMWTYLGKRDFRAYF